MFHLLGEWLDQFPQWAVALAMVIFIAAPVLLYIPELRRLKAQRAHWLDAIWSLFRPPNLTVRTLIGFALAVAVAFGLLLWLDATTAPDLEYSHSGMSPEEQVKVSADCQMRAIEATKDDFFATRSTARDDYFNACMLTHGFTNVPFQRLLELERERLKREGAD